MLRTWVVSPEASNSKCLESTNITFKKYMRRLSQDDEGSSLQPYLWVIFLTTNRMPDRKHLGVG